MGEYKESRCGRYVLGTYRKIQEAVEQGTGRKMIKERK